MRAGVHARLPVRPAQRGSVSTIGRSAPRSIRLRTVIGTPVEELLKTATMRMHPIRRRLRDIHRLLTASRSDYERASARARSLPVRGLLFALSSGRLLMLHELERELEQLKATGPLKRSPLLMNAVQRRWSAMCAVLSAPGDRDVLQACERGERYTVEVIRSLRELPGLRSRTKDLLGRLEADITGGLDDIAWLERGSLDLA